MLVLSLFLQGIPSKSYADCQSDCRNALSAADTLIRDLKKEIDLCQLIVTIQQQSIVTLTLQNDEKAEQLSSAFRNPFILGGIGISMGVIAVILLKH